MKLVLAGPSHKHHWRYAAGVNRTGAFRCSGCGALVALDVLPHGRGVGFAFRVVLFGAGISAPELQRLGDWCAKQVGQPVFVHVDLRRLRHKKRVA